jgi:hypothetical protein
MENEIMEAIQKAEVLRDNAVDEESLRLINEILVTLNHCLGMVKLSMSDASVDYGRDYDRKDHEI